jgi:hypothetical protein
METPHPKKELEYEQPSAHFASRRQFRWLMLLVLINLAITVQTSYWPSLSKSITEQWGKYRESRRVRALQQQVTNWAEPANKVVWDENPETAAALLATPGYGGIRIDGMGIERYPLLSNWPPGARAQVPKVIDQFYRDRFNLTYHHAFPDLSGEEAIDPDEVALVLMHGFKTPAGEDRLVYVYVRGKLRLNNAKLPEGDSGRMETQPRNPRSDRPFSSTVEKELRLKGFSCRWPPDGQVIVASPADRATLLIRPEDKVWQLPWTWTPAMPGKAEEIRLTGGGHYRFYAGQPDPADPSHFTIPYDLDGKRGVIHGRVKASGALELKPDGGRLVGNQWYAN